MFRLRAFARICQASNIVEGRAEWITCRFHHQQRSGHQNHRSGSQRQWRRLFDRRVLFALSTATGFSFAKDGVSDERMGKNVDMDYEFDRRDELKHGWESLVSEPDLRVFRRRIAGPYEMYEYKCAGTYRDISPRTFLDAQNDLKYRSQWDSNVGKLEAIAENGDQELIRWVSKYPYPMYPREYIYVRRTCLSLNGRIAVVDSEALPEEVVPSIDPKRNVRVATYTSRMAVRAHKSWDEKGVDYILTYSDNPEANIPRYVYNWIINHGGPYFLKQVHIAAREIEHRGLKIRSAIENATRMRLCKEDYALEKREMVVNATESDEGLHENVTKNEKIPSAKSSRTTKDESVKSSVERVKQASVSVGESDVRA